jgi:hypothetical protein
MQQGRNSQISWHTTTASDSTCYLVGSMYMYDFIVGLPKSGNKSIIMVVIDCLSSYAHFCALQHPFTTCSWIKIHGMPHSVVSDHDPTFTNNFW